MTTKKTSVPRSDEDQYISESLAHEKVHKPFHDFVQATLEVGPWDYDVVLDEVHPDGWRTIDLRMRELGVPEYLSTIFLPPAAASRFPPALDIPF